MELVGVLSITKFAYRKGLGICDAFSCLSHTLQSALESGQEARIVQINFSSTFDKVNHQGILCKFCSVGINSWFCFFYTDTASLHLVDYSKLWCTVVGAHRLALCLECSRKVFWARHCSSCTPFLENKLIGYADDSTVMAVVTSSGIRVAFAKSMNCDIVKVSEWCYVRERTLNTVRLRL